MAFFNPNQPHLVQSGSTTVQGGESGGIDPLNTLIGIGLGIGTGNWAPLISGLAGSQAGGLYTGITSGDWGGIVGGGGGGKEDPTITNTPGGTDKSGGEMDTNTDPNNPNNLQLLASEQMTPNVGQPLAPRPGMLSEPQFFTDPMEWYT